MSLIRVLHAETLIETHAGVSNDLRRAAAGGGAAILRRLESTAPGADFNLWEMIRQSVAERLGRLYAAAAHHAGDALINGVEHGEKQWKHIFALPVPRHAVYAAKFLIALALAAASTLILCALIVIVGLALIRLRPDLPTRSAIPFVWILKHAAFVWLASWLIIAIHIWVSVRWQGFALALAPASAGPSSRSSRPRRGLGKYYPGCCR